MCVCVRVRAAGAPPCNVLHACLLAHVLQYIGAIGTQQGPAVAVPAPSAQMPYEYSTARARGGSKDRQQLCPTLGVQHQGLF